MMPRLLLTGQEMLRGATKWPSLTALLHAPSADANFYVSDAEKRAKKDARLLGRSEERYFWFTFSDYAYHDTARVLQMSEAYGVMIID